MKKKLIAVSFCLTILISLLVPMSASAAPFGGKWTQNPTYYDSSWCSSYVTNSVNSWNGILANNCGSNIRLMSTSLTSALVLISAGSYGDIGWAGLTTLAPSLYGPVYSSATVAFNNYFMFGYSETWRQSVVSHELGHVLGLNETYYTTPQTVMYYSTAIMVPYPINNDITDLASVY